MGGASPFSGLARIKMMICKHCEEPLVKTDFNTGYYLYRCLNWDCPLHHERQGTQAKGSVPITGLFPFLATEPKKVKQRIPTRLRPNYQAYLKQKKENYRTLLKLGLEPREAAKCVSNKSTKEIVERERVMV